MSLETFFKLFDQYGWPGILAIVCILVIYYFISKKDKKSLDTINKGFVTLTDTIAAQNKSLVTAITESNEATQTRLFNLIDKSLDSKEIEKTEAHKKSLSKRSEISESIDSTLFDMLLQFNAQRVAMIEFHNSKHNLDGLAFMWYDIQHEKQQRGISSISALAKDLQLTNLRPVIQRVNASSGKVIHLGPEDIENIYNESTVLYSQLKDLNVSNVLFCGVYNTDTNELIGLICIEYQEGYPYYEDLIDYYILKENVGIIEHLYNQARIALNN